MVGNRSRVVFLTLLLGLPSVGCSGDDDDVEEATELGSCNGIAAFATCTEMEGDAAFIAEEQQLCTEDGDAWSTEPCPTANLIGCCRSAFGDAVLLDCYYIGYPLTAMELAEDCVDFFEGTWTTGSR